MNENNAARWQTRRTSVELKLHIGYGAMIFLFIFLTTGFFVLQSMEVLVQFGGSNFALLGHMLFVFLPITCVVIGIALIAAEFRQGTQLFLEGLPMH